MCNIHHVHWDTQYNLPYRDYDTHVYICISLYSNLTNYCTVEHQLSDAHCSAI